MTKTLITYDQATRSFHLHNDTISYILQVDEDNILSHVYFGQAISHYSGNHHYPRRDRGFSGNVPGNADRAYSKDTMPQEFSGHGGMDYRIPGAMLRRANGSNLLDLRYLDYRIEAGKPDLVGLPQAYVLSDDEASTLVITMKDRFADVFVELNYTIYRDRAVIARATKVINQTKAPLQIEKIASLQLDLTHDQPFDEVISLPGAHQRERMINREAISFGTKRFESRRGTTSHQMNSFIALVNHDTNEDAGPAIGIHLVYSGNHAFELEKDQLEQTRVVVGINDYNFSWTLADQETFQTPEVLMTYAANGLNEMSHTFHALLRERVARGQHQFKERPILINNWEATYFDFTSHKLEKIIDEADGLGIEMFVLDDGWFGHRDSDNSSLGDWHEYAGKLADGLCGIADYVHNQNMQFGLWFEPEMISLDSDLYRTHPDYLMQEPGRTPSASRDQYVLDMGRAEVRDAIYTQMTAILDTVPIDYIKWDMNRHLSDVFGNDLAPENQGATAHRYMLGVYDLLEKVTTRYPHILWEGCSGGGGRFDAGFLYYMPQSWTSDDTDAIERLKIQYGTSLAYPLSSMTAHVSAVPNHQTKRVTPLKTRGDVAMSGVFGYELDLTHMAEAEKATVKDQIKFYRSVRPLVQFGDFTRLSSPFTSSVTAWQFTDQAQDEALVLVARPYAEGQPLFNGVRLAGLDAAALYEDQATHQRYYGDELMNIGLYVPDFEGDYQSAYFHFRRV